MKIVNYLKWIIVILFILVFIFWIKSEIKSHKANHSKKVSKTESSAKAKVTTLPDMYTEYYTLKKGEEPIRVYTPDGYKCDFYGGGKKYFCQPQNSEKDIWGGGSCPSKKVYPYAKYVDLSYYNEEITVACEFKKEN